MLVVVEGKEERGPGMLLQGGTSPAGLSALKGTLMMTLPYHLGLFQDPHFGATVENDDEEKPDDVGQECGWGRGGPRIPGES